MMLMEMEMKMYSSHKKNTRWFELLSDFWMRTGGNMSGKHSKKAFLISIFVLLVSLFLAAPVLANDSGEPLIEEPPSEESVPIEEHIEEQVFPFSETIPQVQTEVSSPPASEVQKVQDNTTCNQEAIAADPYFTAGTQVYRWLPAGGDCLPYTALGDICTVSAMNTPIQDTIDYIEATGTIPSDRKVYVLTGTYYGGANINGNSTALSTLNGLIGIYNPSSESRPVVNGTVTFYGLDNGFTLSGFTINNGQVNIHNMGGSITLEDLSVENTSGMGIYIHTNTNSPIIMDDVDASSNQLSGADIDNTDGGKPYSVTINNSTFDDNGTGSNSNALTIKSLGKITIDGISASRNRGSGVYISSDFSSLSVKNAVLANNESVPFASGSGFGLDVYSIGKGSVTLENIIATNAQVDYAAVNVESGGNITIRNAQILNNNGGGMYLQNNIGTGYIKIYDSQFNNNDGGHGLFVNSHGLIYLSSVSAKENGAIGAFLDNCHLDTGVCTGVGTVTITSPKSAGVMGINDFSDNGFEGLSVQSNKTISLTNIIANGNGYDGIIANNANGKGGVTLKKNISSNEYFTFNNSACENGDHGIAVDSNGTIRIEYLIANENPQYGGKFSNHVASASPGITIQYSEFNENAQTGLSADSKGKIALTNVSANGNGGAMYNGAHLYTTAGANAGVSIKGNKGYICQFNENGSSGLDINALGVITLSNLEVNGNNNSALIYNWNATSAKNITINNATFNNQNAHHGLQARSKGSISLNTVTANYNSWSGAVLYNLYGLGSITVKNSEFNNNSFGNAWNSLEIDTMRNITLYAVSASNNGAWGANLDNCQDFGGICQGKGTVSIKSGKDIYNTFNGNNAGGITILANGNITLSNFMADNNLGTGVYIDNNNTDATGNITISASNKMRNTVSGNVSGLYILSNGTFSAKYLDSNGNNSYGLDISNTSAPKLKNVIIKESTFNKNKGTGLKVDSLGTITLQGVECSDNSYFNRSINITGQGFRDVLSHTQGNDNYTFTASGSDDDYTINLTSEFFDAYLELRTSTGELIDFDDNSGTDSDALLSGMDLADGNYTIVVRSADGTGGGFYELTLNTSSTSIVTFYGASLSNNSGTGNVKILYSSKVGYGFKAWNNSYNGLTISSNGTVNLSQLEVMYNGASGITINNQSDSGNALTIKTATIEGTPYTGMYLQSYGNISLNKVIVNKTFGNDGTMLDNSGAAVNRYVKVTSSSFLGANGTEGIEVRSKGDITFTNVTVENPDTTFAGATLNNTYGTGKVTISGKNNTFNNNGHDGLHITSNGHITLTNVSASNNGNDGVRAINAYGSLLGNIKLNNTQSKSFNNLNENDGQGLYLVSYGTITINKVQSYENGVNAQLDNTSGPDSKKISITNSLFCNTISGPGIYISAKGPVYFQNMWLLNNNTDGATIYNQFGPEQDVFIKNTTASGNGVDGIDITSAGFVNISKLNADDNTFAGLDVRNTTGDEGVTIANSNFYNNTGTGLVILSDGPVAVKTVASVGNSQRGIYIHKSITDITVTLDKVSALYNKTEGIYIQGASSVSANLTSAIGNGTAATDNDGLYIVGNGSTTVTLKKCTFMTNYGSGVHLQNTDGVPTISSSYIFGNDVDGDGQDDIYIN